MLRPNDVLPTRRAVQTQDGGLEVAFDFEHGEVLDDALLDFFEAVVVLVEHGLRVIQVKIVLRHLVQGKSSNVSR